MFQAKANKKRLDVVKSLMACKPKPGASICAFVLEMEGYFDILESLNMVFDTELSINIILSSLSAYYNQFVLSYQMDRKETSIMKLYSLLQTVEQGIKKIDVPSTSIAPVLIVSHNAKKRKTSHSNWKGKAAKEKSDRGTSKTERSKRVVTQGLKKSRRLKHGELNLVMENRKITPMTRIRKYELMLKSGVMINLNNYCYSSEMTRNIISFHDLFKDGYKISFDNENRDILVYSNGCFMFKASPYKGIYENVECISHNGNSFDFKLDDVCESCLLGKMNKSPFTGSCERGEGLLDLVHTDVCGPFRSATKDGKRYYVTFTDDFSRYGYVYLIKHKSDTFEVFKRYQNEVENQLGRKIKVLQSDKGGEYLSIEFFDHLKNFGIVSQLTPPRTPQLNGVAERRNRTLLDMVRSMMSRATLPISFWGYALETAAHILNLIPTKKGCEVFVRREAQDKLEARSEKCLFVDYPEESFVYLFYKPKDNVVYVARRGVFLKREMISKEDSGSKIDLEEIQESTNEEPIVNTNTQQEVVTPVKPDDISLPIHRTSGRVSSLLSSTMVFILKRTRLKEAMKSEIQSMYDNQVWNLVDTTLGLKMVGCKWIFKKKIDMDGKVHTYKARIMLAINAFHDYEIWQMDVKTAFLNGKLIEDVFLAQPEVPNGEFKKGNPTFTLCIKIRKDLWVRINCDEELDKMSRVPYASAIGSIMYAMTCTRPDVSFALSMVSRHQQNPGEGHWTAVKNILKYLRNTKDRFLVYGGEEELRVTGYCDASWQTDKDDSRSQSGWVFLLNGGAVTWKSSKQDTVADSTCESEYIAACEASKEAIWMKNFIGDLGVVPTVQDPIEIFCDNESAVALTKEPKDHGKSKHIERKYHFVRSKVEEGHVIVKHIRSEDNPADPFTKALAKSRHDEHARSIGLKDNIKF
ncbi:retrotransposon protein, putative, ty1-copia subclass [Tanacetum coccineum]